MMIGLSGYARSGKDTVADFLVADHGFTKVSFAQPMRDALYALNPIVSNGSRLQNVIETYGWDNYKATPYGDEIRGLMQRLGTEVGRKQFDEDFWVSIAIDKALDIVDDGGKVVFTDVRFVNEAERIDYYGGKVWRVRRPGVFPANDHASETSMDDYEFNAYIDNNGTLNDLSWMVAEHVA
jgi:hypothetical protein